ncbi:MAG: tetratricopeptide repeat protein [Bacteroidota bacterium]
MQMLQQYLEGTLSEEDRRLLESQMGDHPLFQDAMEGLGQIDDPKAFEGHVRKIQAATHKRLRGKGRGREKLVKRQSRVLPQNFTIMTLAAAAALALIFFSVVIMREENKGEATMADAQIEENTVPMVQEKPIEPEAQAIIADTMADREEPELMADAKVPQQVIPGTQSTPNPSNPTSLQGATTANSPQPTAGTVLPEPVANDISPSPTTAPASAASPPPPPPVQTEEADDFGYSSEELANVPLEESVVLGESELERKEASPKKRKASRKRDDYNLSSADEKAGAQSDEDKTFGQLEKGRHMADLLTEAAGYYDQNNFAKATPLLKEVIQTSPNNVTANYYLGSIYLKQKSPRQATSHLERAANQPNASAYYQAQWELKQAYSQRGKKGNTKKLLTKIASEGGPYAQQAKAELEKLK